MSKQITNQKHRYSQKRETRIPLATNLFHKMQLDHWNQIILKIQRNLKPHKPGSNEMITYYGST